MAMCSLKRSDLRDKVVHGPEIQEILHQSPTVRSFLDSLMKLDYAAFFKALGECISLSLTHSLSLSQISLLKVID